ncbi:MAG: TetR family transcriptional regulator [Microbacterium sp.]|jgi:AcrR family transcriptional regulator|nr:TetR family transcriptional regulator [Microbacterium sp.]
MLEHNLTGYRVLVTSAARNDRDAHGAHPRRGRPRDPRIDEAIRRATLEVLAERGYSGLTLEDVASRAGTNTPALRRRWRSRQHLIVSALLDQLGAQPTPDTGCTRCDLIAGIGTLSPSFGEEIGRTVLPALVADLALDPELEKEFFERLFHPRRASSEAALRRGIERGDIRPDVDIPLILDMLAAPVYYRMLFGHLAVTPMLAEKVVSVVMDGIATSTVAGVERADHPHS